MAKSLNQLYLDIILDNIRICADYKPKFGRRKGVTLKDFKEIYGNDPFYSWFGLDNPLMYTAHKAAGGMTSIYRQIGYGCEKLLRQILVDRFALTNEEAVWSYEVKAGGNKKRKLSLDARLPFDRITDEEDKKRVGKWILGVSDLVNIDDRLLKNPNGVVFEIRQGYKSKDSKRQNADMANAAAAYANAYIPCILLLSQQIDDDILARYRLGNWVILIGSIGNGSPWESSYAFMKEVVGFDLEEFFIRNSPIIREEINRILDIVLGAK